MDSYQAYFKNKRIVVTGGAGFIGSNLVEKLLSLGAIVTVLDNLETGKKENIEPFLSNPLFSFIEGDIRDYETCLNALKDMDAVSHQAALGSVPRSIAHPHMTHGTNATGFLNVLHAAKENGIKRFVFASSSSVYGDSKISPKKIGVEGNLLSPYAVTKHLNEEYAAVYTRLHNIETIGLRYFNVFGPKQDPYGVYAAAIPRFIDAMLNGGEITIHGDGGQTRDFTFVENAVQANLRGLSTENSSAFGKAFNVACGEYYSLNNVIQEIKRSLVACGKFNESTTIVNGEPRKGDIRDSLADIASTKEILGYTNPIPFKEGMKRYLNSYLGEI
jgi:UDP-N-acetylglucosamine/UDP-N-acetylgalactosamine 4-epimerase